MQGYLEQLESLDARLFAIAVRKLADSLSYGTDRSPFLGSGVEYVQSRQYQFGDPVRSIDWRVTARTGKPHIKEFETPRRLPCYFMIDTSASMMIGAAKRSKYETALLLAGGLALASLPQLVLATILDLLSVGDVVRLSQVDRWGAYSDMLSMTYSNIYNMLSISTPCPGSCSSLSTPATSPA